MDQTDFSRRLAGLVNQPPRLDSEVESQTRQDVVTEMNTGKVKQSSDFSEDLQERLRQWPRYEAAFGHVEATGAGRGMEDYPPMKLELVDKEPSPEALALMADTNEAPKSQ